MELQESSKHFIDLLYNTITRMSTNGANCKTALIGLLTVLTALVQSEVLPIMTFSVAAVLVVAFYLLDSHYLYLEKNFRWMEGVFAEYLTNNEKKAPQLLYDFDYEHYEGETVKGEPIPSKEQNYRKALTSRSILPFYLAMIALIACSSAVSWEKGKNDRANKKQTTEQTSHTVTYMNQDGNNINIIQYDKL